MSREVKDGKKFEEDLKRKELKERRMRLQEQRKRVVEEAEAAKEAGDYILASKKFEEAALLSKQLAEKDRMRTFRAMAEQMQELELRRREEDKLLKVREQLQAQRSAKLAEAEQMKLKGDFKAAADIYEECAKLSQEMKEEERAKEFLAMAKEIREKEFELVKKWKQERERKEKELQRAEVLQNAEDALDRDDFSTAAKLYKKAAEISKMLEEEDKAKIFIKRAEEILIMEKNYKKRKAEEEEKRRMQEERALLEAQRSEAITHAEKAMERGKFKDAAKYYEIAGDISAKLGEKDIAQEFKATAKKILETIDELEREYKEKLKKKPLRRRRKILIAKAQQDIENENFLAAAKKFKYAAIISGQMGEDAKVKELVTKVKECMKKEKAKKEEVIERVMRAFKAIITLRSMESEVAVDLYEWTIDGPKQVVIYVWDIGAISLRFEKGGEPKIITGEISKKEVDVRVEGTAKSIMKVAQGEISPTWAWMTGRLVVSGSSSDTTHFLNLMVIPTLEKEKDQLDKTSTWLGAFLFLFSVFFITYFPTWPDLSNPFYIKPLIDPFAWGNTIISTLKAITPDVINTFWINTFNATPYDILHPWIWANLLLFPIIYIVVSSGLNYITIRRYRINQAKEKLRIKRRRAVDRAEEASKKGNLRAAIRLYEEAVILSLRSGEDEVAKELSAKISEIIKLMPKGGKKKKKKAAGVQRKRGESKEEFEKKRKEVAEQVQKNQQKLDGFIQKAEQALEAQDFETAAKFYAKAAEIAKEMGDKEKVVQFSAQAEELLKIAKDLGK
ncbi:MAG: SCP2 sterol-binding domain-containing protein [Promethearchaeota archaeon]